MVWTSKKTFEDVEQNIWLLTVVIYFSDEIFYQIAETYPSIEIFKLRPSLRYTMKEIFFINNLVNKFRKEDL